MLIPDEYEITSVMVIPESIVGVPGACATLAVITSPLDAEGVMLPGEPVAEPFWTSNGEVAAPLKADTHIAG